MGEPVYKLAFKLIGQLREGWLVALHVWAGTGIRELKGLSIGILARMAIKRYHRLDDANNKCFLFRLGGWKLEIGVPLWSGSHEGPCPGPQVAALSL